MHRVTEILYAVADHYNLRVTELLEKSHKRRLARPRQVAMYLCRHLTRQSLPDLGARFGGKHHTTILYGAERIAELRRKDADLESAIGAIETRLLAKWEERTVEPKFMGFTPLTDCWVGHNRLVAGRIAYLNYREAAQLASQTTLDAARAAVAVSVNDAARDILEASRAVA